MSQTENTQKKILEQIELLVTPLLKAGSDPVSRNELFKTLGWDLEHTDTIPITEIDNVLNGISVLVQEIIDLINDPPESILDLADALATAANLFEALENITDFIDGLTGPSALPNSLKTELSNLGKDILDYISTIYLENNAPVLYYALVSLGLIDSDLLKEPTGAKVHPDGWIRTTHNFSQIRYDNIGSLFADPLQYLKDQFLPASEQLDTDAEAKEFSDNLFPRLSLLFRALGFETSYGIMEDYQPTMPAADYEILSRTFTIDYRVSDTARIGATFVYSPTNNGGHGLVIKPFGNWTFVHQLKNWLLFGSISGSIDGFSINQDGVTFPSSFNDVNLDVSLGVQRLFKGGTTFQQIGSTTGTRLEIGRAAFEVFGSLSESDPNYGVNLYIERVALYAGGGEGDSFLNKIFPEPIEADFDLKIGWSKKLGFYIEGSGSLKIAIPVHKEIFGLRLDVVYVILTFENGEMVAEISVDAGLELGPFNASVSRIGLESQIRFEKGNLGPLDADLQFKPPSGIGFKVDTSVFEGGGYLSFDRQEERYVGALELTVKDKISLKVIGILTTKLPGNDDGYSLLLLITAEFQPINLGFGFTLNGVGGLIALNRTMNLNYLRDGVRSNTLDNILFPTDPIANINQIISDLEGAFPIQEGRYAFGPMAIIGWGTPTLITIELGLMIEVPNPIRLAILGVLRAILPTENKQLLKLQVNFIGTIDFEAKFITFDASIFESKLLSFTLEGDMAFRLKYGDNKNFLFSVGGFHPSYTPPPLQLPALRRLTINLLGGNNPRLTLTSYFAVTSNSVQFGAAVDFYYKITGKWAVVGYLGFDVLIQFNPFYLSAQIAASIALMKNGNSVMGIYLSGSVSGPAPWHVQGKAEVKICGIKLKANFDKTFGQPETTTLPNIDVLPKLKEALENKANWQAITPENSHMLVSMREGENDPTNVVIHPFGALGVNQKIVPLRMTINKFGTQRPADYQTFDLEIANSSGANFEASVLRDFFAPAEYLALSDSAKLSRKSFEEFDSGIGIKGGNEVKSSYLMERTLDYEMVIFDKRNKPNRWGLVSEAAQSFQAFTKNGSAAKSALGTSKKPVSLNAPAKVSVLQEKYVIAKTENLSLYNTTMVMGSEAEARVLLEQLLIDNPALTDQIQVVPEYQVA